MSPRVKLSSIIKSIGFQAANTSCYLDKERGELFLIPKDQLHAAEEDVELEDYPDWEKEQIRFAREILADKKGKRYILIPGKFVGYEHSTMENFCFFLDDEKISRALLRAILGAGVFNRFNSCIHRYGVADDWYKYRYDAMKKNVIGWCKANNIRYIEE